MTCLLCKGEDSNTEEGFDHPPNFSSDESESDEEEEADIDTSEGSLDNIISKLHSAGNASTCLFYSKINCVIKNSFMRHSAFHLINNEPFDVSGLSEQLKWIQSKLLRTADDRESTG